MVPSTKLTLVQRPRAGMSSQTDLVMKPKHFWGIFHIRQCLTKSKQKTH